MFLSYLIEISLLYGFYWRRQCQNLKMHLKRLLYRVTL